MKITQSVIGLLIYMQRIVSYMIWNIVFLECLHSRQDAPKCVSGITRVTFEGVFVLLIKEVCARRDKRIEIACIQ